VKVFVQVSVAYLSCAVKTVPYACVKGFEWSFLQEKAIWVVTRSNCFVPYIGAEHFLFFISHKSRWSDEQGILDFFKTLDNAYRSL
jgi:hypothetical protein